MFLSMCRCTLQVLEWLRHRVKLKSWIKDCFSINEYILAKDIGNAYRLQTLNIIILLVICTVCYSLPLSLLMKAFLTRGCENVTSVSSIVKDKEDGVLYSPRDLWIKCQHLYRQFSENMGKKSSIIHCSHEERIIC